jgi:hypothetical protein
MLAKANDEFKGNANPKISSHPADAKAGCIGVANAKATPLMTYNSHKKSPT